MVALGVVLPAVATVFVGFRLWARHMRRNQLGINDYLILPALALIWGMGMAQIIGQAFLYYG
jgi:hypothetical protein